MEYHRATTRDWEASRDIRLRALAEAPESFCSSLEREQAFTEQEWRSRLERGATFLARSGEDVVGTVSGIRVAPESDGRELVGMWVAPDHRGAGVAAALVAEIVAWARAKGAVSLTLWVAEDNLPARRSYEQSGFALTGEREPMRPGVSQLRMRRPV